MGGAGFTVNINGMGGPAGMAQGAGQYYGDYDDEYGEEDGPQVDENGEPIRSPEEIKNIINSIPSFKYEEKKDTSSETKQHSAKQQPGKGSGSVNR